MNIKIMKKRIATVVVGLSTILAPLTLGGVGGGLLLTSCNDFIDVDPQGVIS